MKTLTTAYKNRVKNVNTCASVPFGVEVFLRYSKWTNTSIPSLGFTELGTLDLTPHISKRSNININLEIENTIQGEANYGLLQASQFNLELAEATERGDTVALGTLLNHIMLEYATPYYQYGGEDVHLWELVVRLGDVEGTDYVEHSFIIQWLYDATNDEPSWFGLRRHNPKFTLTGFTLIKELSKRGTAEIFPDLSNKSGVYYDDSEDEAGDLEYTDVMNYPLYPYLLQGLKDVGIEEDNISIEMPVDNDGSTVDFSTIDTDIIETPPAAQKGFANKEHPTPYLWKTSGTKEYYVWVSRYFYLNITVVDTDTGEMTTNDLNPFTGTGITGTRYCRRLWYPLTGNIFYSLCMKEATPNEWYVIKSELTDSGLTGTADDISITNTSQALSFPDSWHRLHWLQADFDTQASPDRLWCVLHDFNGAGNVCDMGYFSINFSGSAAWTNVKVLSTELSKSLRVFHDASEGDASAIGGFRVCYGIDDTAYAMLGLLWYLDGADYKPVVWGYDEAEDTFNTTEYSGVDTGDIFVIQPIVGGNGTVGGFWKADENRFYFMRPSIEINETTYNNDWAQWDSRSISSWSEDKIGTTQFRSMASHGTVAGIEFIMGIGYYFRSPISDYTGRFDIVKITGSSGDMQKTSSTVFLIADGIESDDNRKWPAMSSPALQVSDAGTSLEDRPFTVMKLWGIDADSDDYAGYFLVTYSENLWPQMAYDFESNNPSIAEFLKQVARDYQLLMNVEFSGTIIRPRNQTGTPEETITTAMFVRNGQEGDIVPRYASVRITCNQDGNDYIATGGNPNSRNVLAFSTDFLLPTRCQPRADQLFEDWQYNQVMYDLDARGLIWLKPGNFVYFSKVMPPGGNGYITISGVVHSVSLNKNMQTQLKVRSLNASQLSNL